MQLATLRSKYRALAPVFTERSRRVWAAMEGTLLGVPSMAISQADPDVDGDDVVEPSRRLGLHEGLERGEVAPGALVGDLGAPPAEQPLQRRRRLRGTAPGR